MFYTTTPISNKVLTPDTIKNLCEQWWLRLKHPEDILLPWNNQFQWTKSQNPSPWPNRDTIYVPWLQLRMDGLWFFKICGSKTDSPYMVLETNRKHISIKIATSVLHLVQSLSCPAPLALTMTCGPLHSIS